MKKLSFLFSLLILISQLFITISAQELGAGGWRKGEKQIRIPVSTPEQIQAVYNLKLNSDFPGPNFDHIIAYVTPEELAKVDQLGIPYIIEHIIPTRKSSILQTVWLPLSPLFVKNTYSAIRLKGGNARH